MKKITVDNSILNKTPDFKVGVMICDVKVYQEERITPLIEEYERKISSTIDIKDVVNLPIIKEARDSYKKYGKDPSRYRLAVESLYRRVSKGNKLYRINNVVDLGNILSMETRKSIAVLDYNKIQGDILIRLGVETDEYYGIGRGKLNIKNIPLYKDDLGPFGSSTSDTERTMIRPDTTRILLFIISFSNVDKLEDELQVAKSLYENYANGTNFYTYIV
jgi:DNA/RNA-binding domain of Phe-tRNA-synthetase-like protein